MNTLLAMENLNISFSNRDDTPVVCHLNMQISSGEMIGIIGESGSGKSLTNLAIMGLLPPTAKMYASKLEFKGKNLLSFTKKDWQSYRGNEVGMVFQNPKTAMNPLMKIKTQLIECIKKKNPGLSKLSLRYTAGQLLEQVGLTANKINLDSYPHELSGGTAQRVTIAMALACSPSLLLADEITTGLDTLNKRLVLQLLDKIRRENDMAILLVSHDIHLIKEYTQQTYVMCAGELMESGATQKIMKNPGHPYSKKLINLWNAS